MKKFCAWLLRVMGWTVDSGIVPEKKCIILGAPHTSIMDFVIAYLYYKSQGGDALCMVKEEMFIPVLGSIIKKMGGIPVNRRNPGKMVRGVISEMERKEEFHLAIAPEGSRKPIAKWKTGFHLIATKANIPVYLAYFDWGTKHVGYKCKVELTDDANADMRRIQDMYEEMHLVGKHPQKYITR